MSGRLDRATWPLNTVAARGEALVQLYERTIWPVIGTCTEDTWSVFSSIFFHSGRGTILIPENYCSLSLC